MGQQLRDPWGILVAVLFGGLAAAVASARGPSTVVTVLIGFGVAATVYGVRAVTALTAGRSGRVAVPADVRPWLTRASAAAAAIAVSRRVNRDPQVAAVLSEAAGQAQRAARGLHQRALAVSIVDRMVAVADRPHAEGDHERLTREAGELPEGPLRSDKLAAAAAAGNLAGSHRRLAELRTRLLASIESTVLQLEAVSAQGSVLVSVGSARGDGNPAGELARLADEIGAVRSTLEQTEEITRELLDPAFRAAGRAS